MEKELQNVEKLLTLLHKVQQVKGLRRRPGEREMTNTVEHTFDLTMLCWYIASAHKLSFDLGKILKYALAHDIVEAYAGDTPFHDEKGTETKAKREAEALKRLEKEFPEFSDLTQTIHEYEELATPEAKFVYATDKLVDPLELSMEEESSFWKEENISWETMLRIKTPKIAVSELATSYWKELLKKLEKRKEFFFNNEDR